MARGLPSQLLSLCVVLHGHVGFCICHQNIFHDNTYNYILNGAATFQLTPRSIKNLEKGIEILETQYEKCEEVKAQVSKFKKSEPGSNGETTFFDFNLRGALGPMFILHTCI